MKRHEERPAVTATTRIHIVVVAIVALGAVAHPAQAAAVDKNAAALVTELVTTALGNDARFEVVSSADLRRQLDVEASKQSLGCDATASSCLAEIAGAMGAQLVVTGKLGALDDVVILTLSLFDSSAGKAVGRIAVREQSLGKLSDRVDGAVKNLVASYTSAPDGKRAKLLVLDVEPPDAKRTNPASPDSPPSETPASSPPSALFWGGIGGLAGGVVVGVVGVALYFAADDANKKAGAPNLNAIDANKQYDTRDLFGSLSVGGVVVGVGGFLTGIGLLIASTQEGTP